MHPEIEKLVEMALADGQVSVREGLRGRDAGQPRQVRRERGRHDHRQGDRQARAARHQGDERAQLHVALLEVGASEP